MRLVCTEAVAALRRWDGPRSRAEAPPPAISA